MSSAPVSGSTAADGYRAIERIAAPDADTFTRDYLRRRRPVVLSGLDGAWLPLEKWTFGQLAATYGDSLLTTAPLRDGALDDHPTNGVAFRKVRLDDLIASFRATGCGGDYAMAPVWNFPAAFQRDYEVPPYCAQARYLRPKVWIGKAGTVTPTHRDVPHNLHVHLVGRKHWLLFPPGHAAQMYSRSPFSGMPNFAQVDPEHPDFDRFPRFREATGYHAVVGPGDTLFIPRGWWHYTRSLDDVVSMNFWWGETAVLLATLASRAYKKMRGIRSGEWA